MTLRSQGLQGLMKLPRIESRTLLLALIACVVWVSLVIAVPYMVPADTLTDLSGSVGKVDNADEFSGLGLVPRIIYAIGDRECHQLEERSYFLNGNQMPFCARDLGLFLGLAAGFVITVFIRVKFNPLLVLAGLVPMAIDGGLQLVTAYESTNVLRITTGFIAGMAFSLLISLFVMTIKDDRAEAGKREGHEGPARSS